eukprot:scaffold91685_cov37-Prasinocladus_malaysianus.AAC.1
MNDETHVEYEYECLFSQQGVASDDRHDKRVRRSMMPCDGARAKSSTFVITSAEATLQNNIALYGWIYDDHHPWPGDRPRPAAPLLV